MKRSVYVKGSRYALVMESIEESAFLKMSNILSDSKIIWSDHPLTPKTYKQLHRSQISNHFPDADKICKKSNILYSLEKLKQYFPKDFLFFPYTWFLPSHRRQLESYIFPGRYVFAQAEGRKHSSFITKTSEEFLSNAKYIVQKYIDNPLLLNLYSFDFRVYVVIKHLDPLNIYLYKQGIVKCADEQYHEPSSSTSRWPGKALHKYNHNIIIEADLKSGIIGHKRPLSMVFSYLEQKGHNIKKVEAQIQDIIIKSICSVQPQLLSHGRKTHGKCFQLLSFDFIIDSYVNPWLVGVKHSPSFNSNTSVDLYIKKELIGHTIGLAMGIESEMFKKIYPINDSRYSEYLEKASQLWEEFSGDKSVRVDAIPPLLPVKTSLRANLFNKPSTRRTSRKPIERRLLSSVHQKRADLLLDEYVMHSSRLNTPRNDHRRHLTNF